MEWMRQRILLRFLMGVLPSGLSLGVPAGKSVGFIGTPTAVGNYNFTLTVTATAPGYTRSYSRPFSITVVTCPNWVDTGSPQTVACPSGYSGAITRQLQTDSCSSATQTVDTSNTCACVPSVSDTGATRTTTPCPVGQVGSILEKEQIESCTNNRTWVTVSNSCAPSLPTFAACTCASHFRLGIRQYGSSKSEMHRFVLSRGLECIAFPSRLVHSSLVVHSPQTARDTIVQKITYAQLDQAVNRTQQRTPRQSTCHTSLRRSRRAP